MSPLTCRELVEFLADYFDGELPPEQRNELEAHLAGCAECVTYLRGYEEAIRLGKAAFDRNDEPAGDSLPQRLIDAIIAARRS